MDVYSFFNSRDVADYLRSEQHEFTAAEAAYIVYLSDAATLDEKLAAWQEIVDTMPDCPVCHSALDPYFKRDYRSEHQFLREYIFTEKLMLRKFMDSEGCVYMPHKFRFTPETAIRYGRDEHSLWIEEMPDPFSSFDKCVDSLRHDLEGMPEFDRYCIAKRIIDGGISGYVTLDERFRVLDVTWSHHDASDYDYFQNGTKYDLKTYYFDIISGEWGEIGDFNVVVNSRSNQQSADHGSLNPNAYALLEVRKILDGKTLSSISYMQTYGTDGKVSIEGVMIGTQYFKRYFTYEGTPEVTDKSEGGSGNDETPPDTGNDTGTDEDSTSEAA